MQASTVRKDVNRSMRLLLRAACAVGFAAALCVSALAPLRAQNNAAVANTTLAAVRVAGAKRFTAAQVIAASRLRLGQAVDNAALEAAAKLLADSGAFDRVTYRYETLGGKLTAEFQVQEAQRFAACVLDNFVWFSDGELRQEVSREVPLFDGTLPESGELPNEVVAALQRIITQKGINGTVDYSKFEHLNSREFEHVFTVHGAPVAVTSVEYSGGPLEASEFAVATGRLKEHAYSLIFARGMATKELATIYKNHGYLQARYLEPRADFHPDAEKGITGSVGLTFTPEPGLLYTWAGASWAGNQAATADELNKAMGMTLGQVAAADKIADGWEAVGRLYGTRGYLTAQVGPEPHYDDAARQVHFQAVIHEGAQYHMGQVSVTGIMGASAEVIRSAWKLAPGAVYDASYYARFVKQDLPEALSMARIIVRQTETTQRTNSQSNVVDVEIKVR
jgi:outer membrane protein assembly factor BamA